VEVEEIRFLLQFIEQDDWEYVLLKSFEKNNDVSQMNVRWFLQ
jgi:hypothetical protein